VYPLQLLKQGEDCGLPRSHSSVVELEEMCLSEITEFFQALTFTNERRLKVFELPLDMQIRILENDELGVDGEDAVVSYVQEYEKYCRLKTQGNSSMSGVSGTLNDSDDGTMTITSTRDSNSNTRLLDSLWRCVRFSQVSEGTLRDLKGSPNSCVSSPVTEEVFRRHGKLHRALGKVAEDGCLSDEEEEQVITAKS
jgi:hypothetical protein